MWVYHTLSSYGWEFCWLGHNAGLLWRCNVLTRSPWCLPGLWHVGRTGEGGVEVDRQPDEWKDAGLVQKLASFHWCPGMEPLKWAVGPQRAMSPGEAGWPCRITLAPSGPAAGHGVCRVYKLAGGCWSTGILSPLSNTFSHGLSPLALLSPSALQSVWLCHWQGHIFV